MKAYTPHAIREEAEKITNAYALLKQWRTLEEARPNGRTDVRVVQRGDGLSSLHGARAGKGKDSMVPAVHRHEFEAAVSALGRRQAGL